MHLQNDSTSLLHQSKCPSTGDSAILNFSRYWASLDENCVVSENLVLTRTICKLPMRETRFL